jgi:hypothetical protein
MALIQTVIVGYKKRTLQILLLGKNYGRVIGSGLFDRRPHSAAFGTSEGYNREGGCRQGKGCVFFFFDARQSSFFRVP